MLKLNRNFGKLDNDNNLTYAPIPLVINGVNVWTNEKDKFIQAGYFPIERTEQPQKDGYYFSFSWVQENGVIVQKWEEHEITEEEVDSGTGETDNLAEELLDIIGGEIAI